VYLFNRSTTIWLSKLDEKFNAYLVLFSYKYLTKDTAHMLQLKLSAQEKCRKTELSGKETGLITVYILVSKTYPV
jgi:hypothetical protein